MRTPTRTPTRHETRADQVVASFHEDDSAATSAEHERSFALQSGEYRGGPTRDNTDRARVIRDALSLMTVEALQHGLRKTGHPVSGIKIDLVARLSPELDLREPGPSSLHPTTKQLKYVLWLWRQKDLTGRVALKWDDLATRTAISSWIAKHKD